MFCENYYLQFSAPWDNFLHCFTAIMEKAAAVEDLRENVHYLIIVLRNLTYVNCKQYKSYRQKNVT